MDKAKLTLSSLTSWMVDEKLSPVYTEKNGSAFFATTCNKFKTRKPINVQSSVIVSQLIKTEVQNLIKKYICYSYRKKGSMLENAIQNRVMIKKKKFEPSASKNSSFNAFNI